MLWIPGELISFLTFPGVIVHEIAHRFFCDWFNIPVYEIRYFRPLSKIAGHVRHHPTENVWAAFFIGMGPLFINSILCMILTFPQGTTFFLGTSFLTTGSLFHHILGFILYWAGMSIGYNAIPSKQDIANSKDVASSSLYKILMTLISVLFWPFNSDGIGPWCSLVYAFLLSLILPFLILG